ncbi:MAG: hypothetical protein WCQ60_04165, partial [bacterium]
MQSLPQLIIFDLDGTLAESKMPLDAEMAALLGELLIHTKVAVISGASFAQFQVQFLGHLHFPKNRQVPGQPDPMTNLSLLPADASSFYVYNPADARGATTGGWVTVYQNLLSSEEKGMIRAAVS